MLEPGDLFMQKQPDARKAREFFNIQISDAQQARILGC